MGEQDQQRNNLWTNFVSIGTLIVLIFGGIWTFSQNYVSAREYESSIARVDQSLRDLREQVNNLDSFVREAFSGKKK